MPTPQAINSYYAAAAEGDLDALVACFTPDAFVADQDETFQGRDEIRSWREALASSFTYTTEITGAEPVGEEYVVTTHVVGDFPGGVVDLTNRFSLEGDLIVRLVI